MKFSGPCHNVKMAGRCAPWGAQGVDTAYSLFGIKADRLQNAGYQTRKPFRSSSDFRPEAFAASFQTKRIQNISKLSPARIYYVLRIIFGFSLPEKSCVVQDTP